jgi:hypothetical protein
MYKSEPLAEITTTMNANSENGDEDSSPQEWTANPTTTTMRQEQFGESRMTGRSMESTNSVTTICDTDTHHHHWVVIGTTKNDAEIDSSPDSLSCVDQIAIGLPKGVQLLADSVSGDVVTLSSEYCRDSERISSSDQLDMVLNRIGEKYPQLRVMNLSNNRYFTTMPPSLSHLGCLQRLVLSRCESLDSLPENLGQLPALEEVNVELS